MNSQKYEHYKYCDYYKSTDAIGMCTLPLRDKPCLIDTGNDCDVWEEHKAELETEDASKLGGE